MTRNDRISQAIGSEWAPGEINELIRVAYYLGLHRGVKAVCDAHSAQLQAAREKARALRYHAMAEAILPASDIIYHPEYGGDYAIEFGADECDGRQQQPTPGGGREAHEETSIADSTECVQGLSNHKPEVFA